jgi:hypothetical protein
VKLHALTISLAALLASRTTPAFDFDPAAFTTEHNKWRAYVGVTEELRYSPAL